MGKAIFLGIDTSNYMTSICFLNEEREIIYEQKKLLEVKKGEKGLRQSDAVFQHIMNMPKIFKQANKVSAYNLRGIAVSSKPRPQEGSYMPVFLAGVSTADTISSLLDIPIYYTTHQEGHISAGYYSTDIRPMKNNFLAVHLSGGTSEILLVQANKTSYQIERLGGTIDLHAGQLIDRIGVMLGCSFPAGPQVEKLARFSSDFLRFSSSVNNFDFHFSGAEAEAKRRLENGEKKADIARAIEHVIAVTVVKILKKVTTLPLYPKEILLVGGVAQNQYIREYVIKKLEHPAIGAKLFFANKIYSGDNAYGVANIALNNYLSNQE